MLWAYAGASFTYSANITGDTVYGQGMFMQHTIHTCRNILQNRKFAAFSPVAFYPVNMLHINMLRVILPDS